MKIKRSIKIWNDNIETLKTVQIYIKNESEDHEILPISTIFESALIKFYDIGYMELDYKPKKEGFQRITVYLAETSNAKLNELSFIYKNSFTKIANYIIRKIYT